jgi:hypothetical protein
MHGKPSSLRRQVTLWLSGSPGSVELHDRILAGIKHLVSVCVCVCVLCCVQTIVTILCARVKTPYASASQKERAGQQLGTCQMILWLILITHEHTHVQRLPCSSNRQPGTRILRLILTQTRTISSKVAEVMVVEAAWALATRAARSATLCKNMLV